MSIDVTDFMKLAERFPRQLCNTANGTIGYLATTEVERKESPPLILLHGIGSGARSWVSQLADLEGKVRALAWDAPGYGESTPLAKARPSAEDYAQALHNWLVAMGITKCVLVGHSWGAIIAMAYASMIVDSVVGLLLLSPARGYGSASPSLREERRTSRISLVDALGPHKMAEQRADAMLGVNANEDARFWVKAMMAAIVPGGYRAATHMLADSDLLQAAAQIRSSGIALKVVVGSADSITPVEQCTEIANTLGARCQVLEGIGHACYLEVPSVLTQVIKLFHAHDCQVMVE